MLARGVPPRFTPCQCPHAALATVYQRGGIAEGSNLCFLQARGRELPFAGGLEGSCLVELQVAGGTEASELAPLFSLYPCD